MSVQSCSSYESVADTASTTGTAATCSNSALDTTKKGDGNGCYLPLRYVLVLLGFLGCSCLYLLRFGISVAIVAMVNSTTSTDNHTNTSSGACPAALNATIIALESEGGGEYNWSLQEQGFILGTFFWGYFITKCIGGRVAEVIGGRATVGVTLCLCGLLSLLCPLAASWHPLALSAIRLLMGVLQGPVLPAFYNLIARWAPSNERSIMVSVVFAGIHFGAMLGLGLSEVVVDRLGWRWVFYGGGIITLLWIPFWFLLTRNSPAEHPFISAREREFLSQVLVKPQRRVPWGRLLRCPIVYILILCEFSGSWLQTFTSNQAPTFLTEQIGMYSVTYENLMTISPAMACLSYIVFGSLSDFLYRKEILSLLGVRRFMYLSGMAVVVICCTGLILAGCNQMWVFALCILLIGGHKSQPVAYQLTPIDIAPNYSATILGIAGLGELGAFIAPIVNARLVHLHHGWNSAIGVTVLVNVMVSCLYVFGVTTEQQEWNQYEVVGDGREEEEGITSHSGKEAFK